MIFYVFMAIQCQDLWRILVPRSVLTVGYTMRRCTGSALPDLRIMIRHCSSSRSSWMWRGEIWYTGRDIRERTCLLSLFADNKRDKYCGL